MLPADLSGVEIVTELGRRFAAGDGAGAAALFHPEIQIEQPASLPHGGWHTGYDGMAAMAPCSGGTGRGPSPLRACWAAATPSCR